MNPFKTAKGIASWGSNPENVIGSIPYVGQSYWNQKNYEQQQQKLGWDQFVQQQTWAREDNATQRRAADLKAAGLSPVLAAGQAAQAGAVVSTTAPQREHADMSDTALKVMTLLTQKANIETQESQRKLMQLQGQQATAGALKTLAEIQEIPSRIQRNQAGANQSYASASDHLQSARTRENDLRIALKHGISTRPSQVGASARDFRDYVDNFMRSESPRRDNKIITPKRGSRSGQSWQGIGDILTRPVWDYPRGRK